MDILNFRCPVCGREHQLVAQAEEAWGKAGKEMHITQMCIPCQLAMFISYDDRPQADRLVLLADGQKTGWRLVGVDQQELLAGMRKAADRWEKEAGADPCRDNFRQLAFVCSLVVTMEQRLQQLDDPLYVELLDYAIRNLPYCKE